MRDLVFLFNNNVLPRFVDAFNDWIRFEFNYSVEYS